MAAPRTATPAPRSTRAASVRLLPVVTRSSTSTTGRVRQPAAQPEAAGQVGLTGAGVQAGLVAYAGGPGPGRRRRTPGSPPGATGPPSGPWRRSRRSRAPARPGRRGHRNQDDRVPGPTAPARTAARARSAASRRPRTGVSPRAWRSLWALISPRSSGSYADDATVRGKPAGHGSGRVQPGRRAASSVRQSGQTPHQAAPQPWQRAPEQQVTGRGGPALDAGRRRSVTPRVWATESPAGREADRRICGRHLARSGSAGVRDRV